MAGNRVLEFKIYAQSLVRRGIMEAKAELAGLQRVAHGVGTSFKAMGTAFGWVRDQLFKLAAVGAVVAAGFAVTIQKAFTFEKYTLQFKILFGNLSMAKKHMAELADFAARTPFELEGIVDASRLLMTFSEGVLGAESSLRLVGDAAAATGSGLSEVAMWVGRAYSMIAAGKPFGEAAMRLQEMGVLTAKARNKMEDLQATGAAAGDVFGVLTRDLERFTGGMEDLAKSGDGLVSTLKDNVNLALKEFGQVFMEDAKRGIASLIEWLDRLAKNGTIKKWAEEAREVLGIASEVAKAIAEGGEGRTKALGGLADVIIGAFEYAAGKAAELLIKAGPYVGAAIAAGFKSAAEKLNDRKRYDAARAELVKEGQITDNGIHLRGPFDEDISRQNNRMVRERMAQNDRKALEAAGSSALGGTDWASNGLSRLNRGLGALNGVANQRRMDEKPALMDFNDRQARQDRLDAMKKNIAGAKTPELAQAGIVELKAMTDAMEAGGAGAGSGKWKGQYDQLLKDRQTAADDKAKVDAAMRRAEDDRREAAKAKIGALYKSGASGPGALEQAKKDVAADYQRRGEKLNPNQGKPWEEVLAKMKDALEKAPGVIAGKKADLAARQESFRLSTLSPAEQLKARQKTATELEGKIGKERDPEKLLDLRTMLQDQLEAIHGLKTGSGKLSSRSIDVGEIFTRMYGQQIKQDPAERTAAATEAMNATLKRIADKKGGLMP